MTVLVFAQDFDRSADQVVLKLTERDVPVLRIDTSWFPQQLTVDAELRDGRWVGTLRTPHRSVELESLRSAWYRSPTAFVFPEGMSRAEREHANREAKLGLGGEKDYEARVVVIGDKMFAIGIYAGSDASHTDWRSDHDALSYDVLDLPRQVAEGLRAFMAEFRITYSAFDFVITSEGEWVLLESNPSGQYGWLESRTGAPLSDTLADLLARGTPS
jgi:hypothetical protein